MKANPIKNEFIDSLEKGMSSFGYKRITSNALLGYFDDDIYGLLTISVDSHRQPGFLFFLGFCGVGSKNVRRKIADVYEEKPKFNIPLISRPIANSVDGSNLSDIPISNKNGVEELSFSFIENFKTYESMYIRKNASLPMILQELRRGDGTATWEDSAERRLAILSILSPEEVDGEYSLLMKEGKEKGRFTDRLHNFYGKLKRF